MTRPIKALSYNVINFSGQEKVVEALYVPRAIKLGCWWYIF
jgi:hypothetical protein